jgi:HD superfamily phosphohydrolase
VEAFEVPKVYWGEIKDPVHGYVYITEAEKEIIDSYPLQRLRRLRQLAGSEYVYPGANHTRFEHCVGVMYLASKAIENPNISRVVSDEEVYMARVAALLHDVGHGPFSHIFEQLLIRDLEKTHEDITSWIIEKSELSDKIAKMGYKPEEVGKLAVGKLHKPGKAFLDQLISSAVDVDKQDFIVRDTFHTGAEYGFIDVFRLIHALDVLGEDLAVELGLTAFKTPEEYLTMDDYTVWAGLKKCEASKDIIGNLERRRMLKCAYERTFYEKDTMISNIFGREAYRRQMQSEIAKEAGVDVDAVVIDVPTVPSVPYHHAVLMESMEIPVFSRSQAGKKTPYRLSEISKIIENLKGFINIMRVYTPAADREKVERATAKILGKIPETAKISY